MRHPIGRLAVILMVLLLPAAAEAQALLMLLVGDKIVGKDFQPGLTVSAVGSGLWGGVHNNMQLSWSIGIFGEIRLADQLSLQPEFLFKSPGGAKNMSPNIAAYPFEPNGEPTLDELVQDGKVRREFRSIAFPLMLKWRLGLVSLGLGPQVQVVTRATDTVSKERDDRELSLTGSIEDDIQWYDVGIATSIECRFSKDGDYLRQMRVRLKGVLGVVDTVENNPGDPMRNWTLLFGLDIPLGDMPEPEPTAASAKPAVPEPEATAEPAKPAVPEPEATAEPAKPAVPEPEATAEPAKPAE